MQIVEPSLLLVQPSPEVAAKVLRYLWDVLDRPATADEIRGVMTRLDGHRSEFSPLAAAAPARRLTVATRGPMPGRPPVHELLRNLPLNDKQISDILCCFEGRVASLRNGARPTGARPTFLEDQVIDCLWRVATTKGRVRLLKLHEIATAHGPLVALWALFAGAEP